MTRWTSLGRLFGALVLGAVVSLSSAAAQEPNPQAAKKQAVRQKEKLSRGGKWVGRITELGEGKVALTLREAPAEPPSLAWPKPSPLEPPNIFAHPQTTLVPMLEGTKSCRTSELAGKVEKS